MSRRNNDPELMKEAIEFIRFAEDKGCKSRQNGTSHVIVTSPINGKIAVIPAGHGGSGREVPKGTRRSILRQFAQMGIMVLPILLVVGIGLVLLLS